jgi:hypothetical protein
MSITISSGYPFPQSVHFFIYAVLAGRSRAKQQTDGSVPWDFNAPPRSPRLSAK